MRKEWPPVHVAVCRVAPEIYLMRTGAAMSFCKTVNASEIHRCDRSSHIRDWGPEPHWVAVVELLLVASVSKIVVGAGYPYFKVSECRRRHLGSSDSPRTAQVLAQGMPFSVPPRESSPSHLYSIAHAL